HSKVLFKIELVQATTIPPRETTTLGLEVRDVDATLSLLSAQAKETGGRAVEPPQRSLERTGRVTARVVYDVPLAAAPGLLAKFKSAGILRVDVTKANPQAPEGKLALARIEVVLSN